MPVVGAIPAHIEQVPRLSREVTIEIHQQRARAHCRPVPLLHVPQARDVA